MAGKADVKVAASPYGTDDELGALNRMTPAAQAAIMTRADASRVYDLSIDYFIGMPSFQAAGDPAYQIFMSHTPSGTAVGMGRAVAKGRGVKLDDVIESGRHGHTGARKTGAIGFAALRGGQVVGEHSLIFAAGSEHIVLTHRAFERRTFATGAVRAALWAVAKPPGLYSMMDVLGMA